MPTPAQPFKSAATQLEPELLAKLISLQSMPPAERARTFKSLEKDLAVFVALILAKAPPVRGQRKDVRDSSRFAAKLVSQDLKGFSKVIAGAAERRDKQFFVDLGKYLSGELKAEIWDKLDIAVGRILLQNPSITAKKAVRELERLGFRMSKQDAESVFRMRKKRLKLNWLIGEFGSLSRDNGF